ncbi:2-phosphosulfolactate phosphatase [Anabaena lutea]|uniref:Probable 2-phosphosulfolactate phosphatase n=1 Tax=Anabaena lutea FACHB-196 TaxID=2692881 RepID=A0ABR8FDU3_9NOST|nr:2-phosphosulfolactate phosphatase [Anabaena lutea]MBD2567944.1 2-phosphosulfolactate phosphatase [Anabaena lutea FACHB-196]
MIYNQIGFDLRCEWGKQGVEKLAPISDVIIIVDVLSFSSCVEIATNNNAIIFPFSTNNEYITSESVVDYAQRVGAETALPMARSKNAYSLSLQSLVNIPPGTKLVLPSLNGSTLSLLTGQTPTLAGCLRNCQAVAQFAKKYGNKIAVIPAGEKWQEDRSLRPAFEDLIGAGAILSYLPGSLSPEAAIAVAAFQTVKHDLLSYLQKCSSGKELIAKGFDLDVELASAYNVSNCVPVFTENAYIKQDVN